jgi:KDO2-lipid IV(A) lauroyltransferase
VTLTELRYRLEYRVVLAVRALAGVLPPAMLGALGTAIGLAFYTCDRAHRRLSIAQLRAAFPTRSARECRDIARRMFAHFGRLLVRMLEISRLSPAEVGRRMDFEGEERVHAALAAGKGVIVFSGHFGYWEMMIAGHPLVLPPMTLVVRPLSNPYLNDLLAGMRSHTGNRLIARQGGLRRILRALQANECVGILIDQHIQGSDAVMVDFFDRPAATTAALATLALRTGAPLIPAFTMALPGGRYRLIYEHPVEPPGPDSADPVRELTQRCSDVLEMYVRRHPHLWLWMHRRWRGVAPREQEIPGMFPAAAPDEREQPE